MKATPPEQIAAMVADYVAGMSSTSVALKWGSSSNTVLRHVRQAGVIRDHATARALTKARRQAAIDAEYGLADGRWVPNHRGIQVWRAA